MKGKNQKTESGKNASTTDKKNSSKTQNISNKKTSKWRKRAQKRRKKSQRACIMTKPSLKKMFATYFAMGLCLVFVVCATGTEVAVSYYRDMKEAEFDQRVANTSNQIVEAYREIMELPNSEEENMSLWKTAVRWKINSLSSLMGDCGALYEQESRTVLVDNKQVIHIILIDDKNTENKRTNYYECSPEIMADAMKDYDEEWSRIDPDGDGEANVSGLETDTLRAESARLEIEDIYVKGGEFVPGKVNLVCDEDSESNPEETVEKVLKEYDYTPEDTSQYTHVVVKGDDGKKILGPIQWEQGFEESRAVYENYMASDYLGEDIWESSVSYHQGNYFLGCESVTSEEIELTDDFTVRLIMATDINLFRDYGIYLVLGYVAGVLLAVLISFAIAYRNYMTRLSHYQLDAYRRETTNAMAHDLKTPLMAISGYAENLRNNVHSEKKDYYADRIVEHVQYMNEMVGNILELAKVENVGSVPDKKSVDMKALTEEVWKKYEILTADKNVWMETEGEMTIQADNALITQAVENLVSNAMKYAKEDSTIVIRLEKDCYEIRNLISGKLDMDVQELWKPFVKGDNSRNEQRGTGIGLTIVKNIVDVHGYELVLQCEGEEFIVRILC